MSHRDAHKRSVIERLRAADAWLERNGGPPMLWVRDLVRDAALQLESESGVLVVQTVTGLDSHVRLFAHGSFGVRQIDALMEVLQLTRSWMERDERAAALALPQADDAVRRSANQHEPPTRDEESSR